MRSYGWLLWFHISVGCKVDQPSAENEVTLAPEVRFERITFVSGATVFKQNRWFPMTAQKLSAEKVIRASGISYTFFCPTWPMEQVPHSPWVENQ